MPDCGEGTGSFSRGLAPFSRRIPAGPSDRNEKGACPLSTVMSIFHRGKGTGTFSPATSAGLNSVSRKRSQSREKVVSPLFPLPIGLMARNIIQFLLIFSCLAFIGLFSNTLGKLLQRQRV